MKTETKNGIGYLLIVMLFMSVTMEGFEHPSSFSAIAWILSLVLFIWVNVELGVGFEKEVVE